MSIIPDFSIANVGGLMAIGYVGKKVLDGFRNWTYMNAADGSEYNIYTVVYGPKMRTVCILGKEVRRTESDEFFDRRFVTPSGAEITLEGVYKVYKHPHRTDRKRNMDKFMKDFDKRLDAMYPTDERLVSGSAGTVGVSELSVGKPATDEAPVAEGK